MTYPLFTYPCNKNNQWLRTFVLWLGLVFFAGTPVYFSNNFSPSDRTELVLAKPIINLAQVLAFKKQVKSSVSYRFYNKFALKLKQNNNLVIYHRQLQVKTKLLTARCIAYNNTALLIRQVVPRIFLTSISAPLLG